MKVKIVIAMTNAERENLNSISDLEIYVSKLLTGDYEPTGQWEHYIKENLDWDGSEIHFECDIKQEEL